MGKVLLKVKRPKCKLRLIEFEAGRKGAPPKMHSLGAGKGVALVPDKEKMDRGVCGVICPRCGTESDFDAKYLPKPEAGPKTLH